MSAEDDNTREKIERYRELVLQYEQLDKQIDDLIMSYGGGTEKMPPEELERYRELARQRADVKNEMLWLEQELMADDEE